MNKPNIKKPILYYANCVLIGVLILYALVGGFALVK